jgi:hypothetical protein
MDNKRIAQQTYLNLWGTSPDYPHGDFTCRKPMVDVERKEVHYKAI